MPPCMCRKLCLGKQKKKPKCDCEIESSLHAPLILCSSRRQSYRLHLTSHRELRSVVFNGSCVSSRNGVECRLLAVSCCVVSAIKEKCRRRMLFRKAYRASPPVSTPRGRPSLVPFHPRR